MKRVKKNKQTIKSLMLYKFSKIIFLTLFSMVVSSSGYAQFETGKGTAVSTGGAVDFSSPYAVTAFPAVPVCCGEDEPTEDVVPSEVPPKEDLEAEAQALKDQADKAQEDLSNSTDSENEKTTQDQADKAQEDLSNSTDSENEKTNDAETATALEELVKPKSKKNYPTDYFGMSFLGAHLFYETGNVNRLQDKLDKIKKSTAKDANLDYQEILSKLETLRQDVRDLEEDGFISLGGEANLLTPVVFWSDALGGVMTTEISYVLNAYTQFLAGSNPLDVGLVDGLEDCERDLANVSTASTDCLSAILANPTLASCVQNGAANISNCKIYRAGSDSSLLAKGYRGPRATLGYSRQFGNISLGEGDWLNGDIFVGLKYNYFSLKTYQINFTYKDKDSGDSVNDMLEKGEKSTSIHDLEPGVKFVSQKYELGLAVKHLLSPKVDYLEDDVTLKPKPYIVGTLFNPFSDSRSLSLNFYQDLADEVTMTGLHNKWRIFSLSYSPQSFLIPAVRLGKRYNLVRTQHEYTHVGLTLFNILNLDIGYNNVIADGGSISLPIFGSQIPTSLFFNLSFDLNL